MKRLWFPGIIIIGLCFMVSSCAQLSVTEQKDHSDQPYKAIEDQYGIKVLGVQLSAAGYMLDFRYRVVNPEKSSVLFHPTVKPYLVHQKSGKNLIVPTPPKVGALRQRSVKTAAKSWTSFILFSNPGNMVKSSDKVTVVVGDVHIKNLVVR